MIVVRGGDHDQRAAGRVPVQHNSQRFHQAVAAAAPVYAQIVPSRPGLVWIDGWVDRLLDEIGSSESTSRMAVIAALSTPDPGATSDGMVSVYLLSGWAALEDAIDAALGVDDAAPARQASRARSATRDRLSPRRRRML